MKTNEEILYDYAMSFLLVPYKYGGQNCLTGLDCSQLIIEIAAAAGLPPHRDMTAQELYRYYSDFGSETKVPSFGTLSFYGKSITTISHIGFCLNEKFMINAAGGGPLTRTLEDAQQQSAFVKIRSILYRGDLVSLLKVRWPMIGE